MRFFVEVHFKNDSIPVVYGCENYHVNIEENNVLLFGCPENIEKINYNDINIRIVKIFKQSDCVESLESNI